MGGYLNLRLHGNLAYVFSLALLISGCSSNADEVASNQPPETPAEPSMVEISKSQFDASHMQIGVIEQQLFHEVVNATGVFDVPPSNHAAVSTFFGGTVHDVFVLPGEYARKGQVLFTLENPEFIQMQQDYLEAKSQLTYLAADYERQKNLLADSVSSVKKFLKAEADYQITLVRKEALGKKLSLLNINPESLSLAHIKSRANIIAPIDGMVSRVDISKGVFLNPSEPAIYLVDTDHLHLELKIFEGDMHKVKPQQSIQFKVQNDEDTIYEANVFLVNKIINPSDRTISVHGHLTNEMDKIMFTPGMYVEAKILVTDDVKPALPENAVVEVEGKSYALVLHQQTKEGYTFMQKEVETGQLHNGYVEIKNADSFPKDAQILTVGAFWMITE